MDSFKIEDTKIWLSPESHSFMPFVTFPDDEIAKEIVSFGNLPNGWDYGEGITPSLGAISNATMVYLISRLQGFSAEPHPNSDGTITLILFKGDHFLDVDISAKDKLLLRYEIGKGKDYKVIWENKEVPLYELEYILIEIKAECHKSTLLETSTSKVITAPQKEGFKIIKFLKPTKEESQYFVRYVPLELQNLDYAVT